MKQVESNNWAAAVLSKGGLPRAERGEGIYIYDSAGKRYIDASGGPAVYCLGHNHPEVNEAINRQLGKIAHAYRYSFTSDAQDELSALIEGFCGNGLSGIVYVSGGSEAVESALKIALQYHSARGEQTRRRFISRRRSWHGNTLGALSVSDFSSRRQPFEGALIDASFVSSANAYRPPAGIDSEDLADYLATELEEEILRRGANRIAGFIFEPIVGAAGGVVPAPAGYARKIRDVCTRHGVLMIADEVMCGSARCGTWRALEHDGVVPDIMAVAKGLGAGYVPLGAAIYHRSVLDVLVQVDGGPLTGHTFTAHTAACAAGAAVQTIVKRDGLVERVRTEGELFKGLLCDALGDLEAVGEIRGRGFFVGVEFVADRSSKVPFDHDVQLSARINNHALSRGLLCYSVSGNVDGTNGDAVILAPPYIATRAELTEIVRIFADCTIAALRDIGRA
ncbi:MAG: aspartate aminotransferase family protein [Steroidobacteraceae bacterium]|jgi:adenosylmethionine-8-amino-7-oxononanoate aminotransferase